MASNVIQLSPAQCTGCGVCVDTCPELVLARGGPGEPVQLAHPERCLGCMSCEEDCARQALRVLRLPDGLAPEDVPPPACGLDLDHTYDLVVIGAGPAGLGAALRARALGHDVAVIDRLPSPRRAHHPDGGLLFGGPDLVTLEELRDGGFRLVELDLACPASAVLGRVRHFVLVGPAGDATRRGGGVPGGMLVVSKDRLMETLAAAAVARGVALAWNTRASEIRREADGLLTVRIDDGAGLRGRLVVCAEGIGGRLAERAGIPVNADTLGWSYGETFELPVLAAPTEESGFLVGAFSGGPQGERPGDVPDEPRSLTYYCSGSSWTHLMPGTLQAGRARVGSRPLHEQVAAWLARDDRLTQRLGGPVVLGARSADGCRGRLRRTPRTAVGDGILAVGDALATCGMMTTLGALRCGMIAAEVASEALAAGNTRPEGLAAFDRRVSRLSVVAGMAWMSGPMIEAPLALQTAQLDQLYRLLARLDLSAVQGGGWRGGWAMVSFYLRILPALLRRDAAVRFLVPRQA